MAQYEVPTPSTLLLRVSRPELAGAALHMLAECLPPPRWESFSGVRVATLSDVSSDASRSPHAACLVWTEPATRIAKIDRFAVTLPFRRRGLGRRLLTELSTALQAEGAEQLWILVPDDRLEMRALLGSAGFVISLAEPPAVFPAEARTGEDGSQASWWVRDW